MTSTDADGKSIATQTTDLEASGAGHTGQGDFFGIRHVYSIPELKGLVKRRFHVFLETRSACAMGTLTARRNTSLHTADRRTPMARTVAPNEVRLADLTVLLIPGLVINV